MKGLGPEHGGPLHPGATLASMWGRDPAPSPPSDIWPCHDLTVTQAVVHLFLHLANIESVPSATCVLPCPSGACRVGPVALNGHLWGPQPFCSQWPGLPSAQNPIPLGWVFVRCCKAFSGPGSCGRGSARVRDTDSALCPPTPPR